MTAVARFLTVAAMVLVSGAGAARAQAPADTRFLPLAHSGQISVDAATLTPNTLTLRIRDKADKTAVAATQVQVSARGRALPVTANSEGTWNVALRELGGKPPGKLDLVIGHDGIRELLSGTMTSPAAGAATAAAGLLRDHKQLAWWILNIVIVLIAALAISRRMS